MAKVTSDKSVSSQRSLKAFGHFLSKPSQERVNTSVMLCDKFYKVPMLQLFGYNTEDKMSEKWRVLKVIVVVIRHNHKTGEFLL